MKTSIKLSIFFFICILSFPIYSQTNSEYEFPFINKKGNGLELYLRNTTEFEKDKTLFTNAINRKIADGFLLSKFIKQSYDSTNWVNYSRDLYDYDLRNNMIEDLQQIKQDTNWINSSRDIFEYDGNNNTKIASQFWVNLSWSNASRVLKTYDNINNLIEFINQSWNGSNWVNTDRNLYVFDNNNIAREHIYQKWNGTAWDNFFKNLVEVNKYNNIIENITLDWKDSSWVNYDKYLFTYDKNNIRTGTLILVWNDSIWTNSTKFTYSINGNYVSEELAEIWNGSEWVNRDLYLSNYDEKSNLIKYSYQYWKNSAWINLFNYSYIYDEDNNRIEYLYHEWDNSKWVPVEKGLYSYIKANPIEKVVPSRYLLSQNYPNPFNPVTTIKYNIPQDGFVVLKIYDILGREVRTLANGEKSAGNYSVTLNASSLASGVYFYRLSAGNYTSIKKMVVLK